MADTTFGPVELYLVSLEEGRPTSGILDALREQIDTGTVRLLDLLVISKSESGEEITVVDVEDGADDLGIGEVELDAAGIAGEEDIRDFAEMLEPGETGWLVVIELSWARQLVGRLGEAGAEVLNIERVPAPVVNALVDLLSEEA